MGTWGDKPFENDSAMDWTVEVEDLGVRAIHVALKTAAQTAPNDYLDSDEAFFAVAAAELVAAARDGDTSRLPAEMKDWLARAAAEFTDHDPLLALRALERVMAANSELPTLWSEVGRSEWHVYTEKLIARLSQGAPTITAAPPRGPAKKQPAAGKKAAAKKPAARKKAPPKKQAKKKSVAQGKRPKKK